MTEGRPETPAYFLPNKMGRIVLLALEEVVGHTGVNAVLNLSELHDHVNNYPPNNLDLGFRFDDLGAMNKGLDSLYGPRGGRGLALRTGRACFAHALRDFGPMLGLTDLSFRLLPLAMKVKAGMDGFAELFNRYTDQVVRLDERPEEYWVHIDRCALCWGRHTDGPSCHIAVGFIQEAFGWLSGGKNYLVEETACAASGGGTCSIRIQRQPVD